VSLILEFAAYFCLSVKYSLLFLIYTVRKEALSEYFEAFLENGFLKETRFLAILISVTGVLKNWRLFA
jgi:hypothetical protein